MGVAGVCGRGGVEGKGRRDGTVGGEGVGNEVAIGDGDMVVAVVGHGQVEGRLCVCPRPRPHQTDGRRLEERMEGGEISWRQGIKSIITSLYSSCQWINELSS